MKYFQYYTFERVSNSLKEHFVWLFWLDISRWTLLVCKLQEYVTFAFVWAELTEVTSREKTNFTESLTANLSTNARDARSSFYEFFVDIRAENLISRRLRSNRDERAFWNQRMASISMSINHLHGNWYERLVENFSL